MSFKSRQKKRAARLAIAKIQADNRDMMASRHYLTIVSRPACCNQCGGSLRDGVECVYRHTPREILCVACAESAKVRHRPSRRWEKARRKAA